MPGIPLVTRETSQLRSEDNISPQSSRLVLSPEEEIAAERSLSVYCKPVEFYNILSSRATDHPLFLQRCLKYKIQKKHHRRIQMTVSLLGALGDGFQLQSLFPLDTYLATVVSDSQSSEIEVYHISATRSLTTSNMLEGVNQAQAQFTLPEMCKLAAVSKTRSLFILFISYAVENSSIVLDTEKDCVEDSSIPSKVGKYCSWGKIPLETIISSWERSPKLSHGQRVQIMSAVELRVSRVKFALDKEQRISFHPPYNCSVNTSRQVEVIISTEEVGAKERSPYNSSLYKSSVSSSCPVLRLRSSNVVFNYRYYNNRLQRSEVTEDFSCPFCLVKCGSFKGLRYHLCSSHDLFNFEFWVTEEYQAVNVSVKTDSWRPEIIGEGVDPKQQTFFLCSKPLRRKKWTHSVCEPKSTQQPVFTSATPAVENEVYDRADDAYSSKAEKARSSSANYSQSAVQDPECIQSVARSNLSPPPVLQFARTRKLSVERSESRRRALLEKRKFFHSHRAQPMSLEQVLADHDSEDEVDDDVADLEDRRMLDDFVDVTRDEKQIMHLWNSFMRKQRVLADGHIPWACEAFSRMHGPDLVQAPSLLWCWRMFMLKLWNHALVDARVINNCNKILEQCQNLGSGPV